LHRLQVRRPQYGSTPCTIAPTPSIHSKHQTGSKLVFLAAAATAAAAADSLSIQIPPP